MYIKVIAERFGRCCPAMRATGPAFPDLKSAMSLAREINDEAATAVSSATYTNIVRSFVATSTECDKGE